jgi:hypothetical protein
MQTVAKEPALWAEGADNFIGTAKVRKVASSAACQEKFPACRGVAFEHSSFSVFRGAVNRSHQARWACSDYANLRSFQSESPQAIVGTMTATT